MTAGSLNDMTTLREAFHRVWIENGHGHEQEWEYHWNYATNLKNNTCGNSWMYEMTVYPKIMREAKIAWLRTAPAKPWFWPFATVAFLLTLKWMFL